MREMMERYGLVSPQRSLQLEASQKVRKSEKETGSFMWTPSARGQSFQKRKLRRSKKDLLLFSESPMPSRAIRVVRNAIQSLTWGLQPKDVQKAKKQQEAYDKAVEIAKRVISHPNLSDDDFSSFLGQIVEDVLIFDAGCWEYVERPVNVPNNDVLALEVVPGFTIAQNRRWNGDPRTPRWLQVLDDGKIHQIFLDSEIEYVMQRKRSFDPFGLSPLETAIEVMDTLTNLHAYQRQIASEAYPSLLIYLGDEVDDEQRRIFRHYWENELRGRGTPGFFGGYGRVRPEPIPLKPNGDDGLFLQYHDLLVRVLAVCFDLHPQDFGLERDVNRSTSETSMSATLREGVKPIARTLQVKMNSHVLPRIAQLSGSKEAAELEFWWTDIDPKDEQRQAGIDSIYLNADTMTIDEARSNVDLDPLPHDLGKLTPTAFRSIIGMDPLILLRDEKAVKELLKPSEQPPEEDIAWGDQGEGGEPGEGAAPTETPEAEVALAASAVKKQGE